MFCAIHHIDSTCDLPPVTGSFTLPDATPIVLINDTWLPGQMNGHYLPITAQFHAQ